MKQIRALDLDYRVTFVLPYATLTTVVYALDDDDAIKQAEQFIHEQYGWQPEMWSDDIQVEREER